MPPKTKPQQSKAASVVPTQSTGTLRLEYRAPAELAENPRNWRGHPKAQAEALAGVIREVGWAGACLYNERTGRLIDGHARRNLPPELLVDGKLPVLIGSWSEADEAKILATLDPLAAMAEANAVKLDELLREVQTGDEALSRMLADLAEDAGVVPVDESPPSVPDSAYSEQYGVIVICGNEAEQKAAYEDLTAHGYECRVVTT